MTFKLFEVPDFEKEPLHKILMFNVSRYVKVPDVYNRYNEVAVKKLITKVPEGYLGWGTLDKDYSAPKLVCTKWNGESFGALFLGMRGMGKSITLKNTLLDQIHARWNYYVAAIDPKQVDFSKIHIPMREKAMVEKLSVLGMQPTSYRVKRIIPKCLLFPGEPPPSRAQPYMLSIKDFRCLSPQAQVTGLLYLLSLKQASAPGEALQRVINQLNNPKMRPPPLKELRISTETFYRLVIEDIKLQANQRKESQEEEVEIKRRGGSNQLYFRLRERIEQFIIGDPTEKNKLKVDVVQELVNNGVLVMLSNLDTENERSANVYIKIFINQIIADMVKFKHGSGGRIDRPVVFAIDEADVLAPRDRINSPARSTILQLLTRYRYYGASLFLVTQDPAAIWERLVKQCKYIITPKVMNEDQAALLRERGVPDYTIEELRKLYAGDEKPVQWALIEPDCDIDPQIFYPFPPLTEIAKESDSPIEYNKIEEQVRNGEI